MNLTKKEFKFIKEYLDVNKLNIGAGHSLLLMDFLDEYKRWSKKKCMKL
jgi:hypothetical protein